MTRVWREKKTGEKKNTRNAKLTTWTATAWLLYNFYKEMPGTRGNIPTYLDSLT